MTRKADADISREYPALAAVSNNIFAIAGYVTRTNRYLSTVSCYDIAKDTWKSLKPKLNIARKYHSACTLNGMIYVFCGKGD